MISKVGDSVSVKRIFSQSDFDRFARLSGDENPIHIDPHFAAGTHFGRTVCHGMLLYSSICSVLSSNLPQRGVQFQSQDMIFEAPTFTDEQVDINIVVDGVAESTNSFDLTTNIVRSDGSFACRGNNKVSLEKRRPLMEKETVDPVPQSAPGDLKGLILGQQASSFRTFIPEELSSFCELTGDTNPLFFDKDYANKMGFQECLVPFGLLGGMFSYLLGMVLPGPGTGWLKQKLRFWQPAYPGDQLRAEVEIIRLRPEKELVNLVTAIHRSDQKLVCSGEALVLVREL